MKPFLSYCFFVIFCCLLALFAACERPVPKDVMFCKSQEAFVVETAFDEKTAIIVMYKGDEVRLMGDTAYLPALDSSKVDSSDFYVKVTAKRGVVGWVNKKHLQHERIKQKNKPRKAAEANLPKKEEKPDSNAIDSASATLFTFGTYNAELTGGIALSAEIDTLPDDKRRFRLIISAPEACKKEWTGELKIEGNSMMYQNGDCKISFSFQKDELNIQESGCSEKECSPTALLKRKK